MAGPDQRTVWTYDSAHVWMAISEAGAMCFSEDSGLVKIFGRAPFFLDVAISRKNVDDPPLVSVRQS